MKILIAASEAAPLAKTGGLGDVVGALPSALQELGCQVSVAIPAYRTALKKVGAAHVAVKKVPVRLGTKDVHADILEGEISDGIPVYLVRRDEFFDRAGIYGTEDGDYFDSLERFIFFSRSIPSLCSGLDYHPEVIVGNDWQTGLLMALVQEGDFPGAAGVFAIHNLGYQGLVPPEEISLIGLPQQYYRMEGLEYYGQMSLLKAGIVYGHAVTTVSPSYAEEIQTVEFGCGLDGLLRSVKDKLYGILNGIDKKEWDPESDVHLPAHYSRKNLSGKVQCKAALLREMGLSMSLRSRPLLGMVSRLVSQKGCDLLLEAAKQLFTLDVGLVVLGSGETAYEQALSELEEAHRERFRFINGFDEPLAHRIYGGSDVILVPSRYEPCGLAQLYGLRYGSVPLVRATGGLKDTVRDFNEDRSSATGYTFQPFTSRAFFDAVEQAVALYPDRPRWRAMMREGMGQDFSWRKSAEQYLTVFEKALESQRNNGR